MVNRDKNIGLRQAEDNADKILFNVMTACSVFLSGVNEALDNQDMINIIDQSRYKTINIEPGIYGLTFHSKDITTPEGAMPTIARTLTLHGTDFDTNLTLLHHKKGWVENENVIKLVKEENFPIHMVSFSNFFKQEEATLKKITDEHYSIMNSIRSEQVEGTSQSSLDEDTGLIL